MADQPPMRFHRRVSVCAPITYQVGNEEGEGTAWNLSRCGCQFTGNLSLREGTFFSFTLRLSTSERVYVAAACVCWTEGPNYGVEYLVIDDESVETVAAFIDREAAAVRNRDE